MAKSGGFGDALECDFHVASVVDDGVYKAKVVEVGGAILGIVGGFEETLDFVDVKAFFVEVVA